MTQAQKLQTADIIDSLEVGEGVEFDGGDYVEKVSGYCYEVNGERASFIEAYDAITTAI